MKGILSYLISLQSYLTILFYISLPPPIIYLSDADTPSDGKISELLNLIPEDFLAPTILNADIGFIRIPYNEIKRAIGGTEFINEIMEVIKPLLQNDEGTVVYSFPVDSVPLHMVIGRENKSPYHQDKITGKTVFEKSYDNDAIGQKKSDGELYTIPSNGLRVLIDLGSFDGDLKPRVFKIAIKDGDGFHEKLVTQCRIIAMNAGAAGSGGKSPYFHGRSADGISLQLDLSLGYTKKQQGKSGKKITGSGALNHIISRM